MRGEKYVVHVPVIMLCVSYLAARTVHTPDRVAERLQEKGRYVAGGRLWLNGDNGLLLMEETE